eukprot:5185108-Pyramimonas_sp.AAC.1
MTKWLDMRSRLGQIHCLVTIDRHGRQQKSYCGAEEESIRDFQMESFYQIERTMRGRLLHQRKEWEQIGCECTASWRTPKWFRHRSLQTHTGSFR